jgi:hypothetical protein
MTAKKCYTMQQARKNKIMYLVSSPYSHSLENSHYWNIIFPSTPKMVAAGYFEMFKTNYQTTWRHTPKDRSLSK